MSIVQSIKALARIKSGSVDPDMIAEVLSQLGMEVEFSKGESGDACALESEIQAGARAVVIRGKMGKDSFRAVIVLNTPSPLPLTKALDK